jgi:hypothetical protein
MEVGLLKNAINRKQATNTANFAMNSMDERLKAAYFQI